jgi:hypothetical protein
MIATVTLETAKLLKESGFRQDSEFHWVDLNFDGARGPLKPYRLFTGTDDIHDGKGLYKSLAAAPTTDELLAVLKENKIDKFLIRPCSKWYGIEADWYDYNESGESLVELLAEFWICLAKENLLPLKESRKV